MSASAPRVPQPDGRPDAQVHQPGPTPPRLAAWLLAHLLAPDIREALLGDLAEAFDRVTAQRGAEFARRWYWRQALHAPVALTRTLPAPGRPTRRGDSPMTAILSDLRLAFRSFARRPGFSAVFVVTTALGVGAATAIFSAARPILFAPVPYPHADRIVSVNQVVHGVIDSRIGFNTIADIRERVSALGPVAAVGSWQATVAGSGDATQYTGLRVSPEYFAVLGVQPGFGRDFRATDDVPNSPRMVIISDRAWREQFGADSGVVGREVRINDFPYTVVGVMPAGFEDVNEPDAQFWRSLQYTRTTNSSCRSCQHLRAVGRLRDGVSPEVASRQLNALLTGLGKEFPNDYPRDVGGAATPLGDMLVRDVKPAMTAALAAVLFVLLIACANATNLLLGRATERRAELAVRTALGASRGQLVRQLLVESMLLSGAGGALGVALAWSGIGGLRSLAPVTFPRLSAIEVNLAVLVAALVATTIVGLGFGLLPALDATGGRLHHGIQATSRRTVGRSRGIRSALVISEMALAVLVLTGSGLLLNSMHRLLRVNPGFDPQHVLTLELNVVGQRFAADSVTWRYYDDVLGVVRRVPGVEAAAYTSQLPLSDDYDTWGVHSERHPAANSSDDPQAHRYAVSPGYLELMRIPVTRGRTIAEGDDALARDSVVLVNAAFAARFFAGEDPIGQRVRLGDATQGTWRTIVGVTGDIRQVSLAGDVTPAVYHADKQFPFASSPISLVIRTAGDPAAVAGAVRQAVRGVDPSQAILRLMPMERMVASSAGQRRFVLTLFEAFAAIAGLLAALGVYGVLSASVSERVREIGVREALGATPAAIVAMVVRGAMRLVALGGALGLVSSAFASRYLAGQLFQTSRGDPATYGGVLVALALLAIAACAVPASRAARVDPMVSLRAD